ncbi:hypothetical protein JOM56_001539, partial [Amanita muscaria]
RLSAEWVSPVYAFYKPEVTIKTEQNGKRGHQFQCGNRNCKTKITRWLDKKDTRSTSNLRKHVKSCWGSEVLEVAGDMTTVMDAREAVAKYVRSGSIKLAFNMQGKSAKAMYSVRQHTKTEIRSEVVRWVSEAKRPFSIVEDDGFRRLMKTGRPELWLPSRRTVA